MRHSKKELEKKLLIRKTIGEMDKQIQKLEEQKKRYIEAGRVAKEKGLTSQLNLAIKALRMTLMQQKRVQEMKLNFEITSQMKDMSKMTCEFLEGMGSLSKEMMKLTSEKQFKKVQNQFSDAMLGVEMQTQEIEGFMEDTQNNFSSMLPISEEDDQEASMLMGVQESAGEDIGAAIEAELAALQKSMR